MKLQKVLALLSAALLLCMVFCPLLMAAERGESARESCHGDSHSTQGEDRNQIMQCCADRAVAVSEAHILPLSVHAPFIVTVIRAESDPEATEPAPRFTQTRRFLATVSVLRI